jgi:hypothetical protein
MTERTDNRRGAPRLRTEAAADLLRRLDATYRDANELLRMLREEQGVQVITRSGMYGGSLGHSAETDEIKIVSAMRKDSGAEIDYRRVPSRRK